MEMEFPNSFVHMRSAPYDHLERTHRAELHRVFRERRLHTTHTRNNIPSHEKIVEGRRVFISPENLLRGADSPYSLKHLVRFGTQVTCYIPKEKREGKKTREWSNRRIRK